MSAGARLAGLSGQRALVMGLGLFGGGAATARFLARSGAKVLVTDRRGPDILAPALAELEGLSYEARLGEHREEDFAAADLVVANPAVPPSSPFLEAARAGGARITSELELFLERCPASLALISGTQGKSSTSNFLAQLLSGAGRQVWLGGNIGHSLLDDLEGMQAGDLAVLEVSSYQLEALPRRSYPRVRAAALTNVLADHLERHGDAEGYAAAKARLLDLVPSGGTLVLPSCLAQRAPFADGLRAGLVTIELDEPSPGAQTGASKPGDGPENGIHAERFWLEGRPLADCAALTVPGTFQRDNLMQALCLARALGATLGHLASRIPQLKGLPHRLEDLGQRGPLRVLDNGVCTTPDSALAVLDSLPPASAILLGGQPKAGLEFEALAQRCGQRGDQAYAFGAGVPEITAAFRAAGAWVRGYRSLEEAVAAAYEAPPTGGVLLFSPACASFDAYPNFRARAEAFRALLPTT